MADPLTKTPPSGASRPLDGSDIDAATDDMSPGMARGTGGITARLRRAIESGVYGDGEQLPAERQLAEALGASRSTIRKALDQLEESGLVVRRVGAGTFVNYSGTVPAGFDELTDLISPLQLIEARFAVEPYMTRLAVLNATARDLDTMASILDELEACRDDKDSFTRWDSEFHALLARCSRNALLVHIYQQINAVRSHAQWDAMKELILTPEQIDEYNLQHRALYDALRHRDVAAAVELIETHLRTAKSDLVGVHSA